MWSDSSLYDLSSSDEDVEEQLFTLKRPKNENYFEEIVPSYNDAQYIEHFRVHRNIANYLAERFAHSTQFNPQECESTKITPEKFINVFLWYAGHEAASYRDVADRFNISLSSLYKIIRRVTYFISNLSVEFIKWPSFEEQEVIEAHFRENDFPGVIGVIDGTHIRIDKPSANPDSYLNRKQYYSVQAQIVCDHQRQIRDIFVGFPGSVYDSRVFRVSPLCTTLPQKCQNFYILGDSGYPCLNHLLTPFKDFGNLSRRQSNYNIILSKNRYIIEHCLGLMKQKFRQLYHLKLRNIRDIMHFIRACAVLHNLAINDGFEMEEELHNENVQHFPEEVDEQVVFKRNEVVNILPPLH